MKALGTLLSIIGMIVLVLCLTYGWDVFNLWWKQQFSQKYEDVNREAFDPSESYSNAVTALLWEYYEVYLNGDEKERAEIKAIVSMRFAEFDENRLNNDTLKRFLISARGY